MLNPPLQFELDLLPELAARDAKLTARYLVAKDDMARGVGNLIVETLGHGVGQVAEKTELRIVPCRRMRCAARTTPIAEEIARGDLSTKWSYLDVSVDSRVLDIDVLGFSGLLSLFAGDVFGRPYAESGLILHQIDVAAVAAAFPGPRFGSHGVLAKCARANPHVVLGILMKPDMGMTPEYYADLAEAAALGGIDYIKEDELTLDSPVCPRLARVEAVSSRLGTFECPPLYAANATVRSPDLAATCKALLDCGASALLINGLQVGLDAVAGIAASPDLPVPVHLHRAGHDILNSGPKAISATCLTMLFRLSGADVVHVGSPIGSTFPVEEVLANMRALIRPLGRLRVSLPVLARSSLDLMDFALSAEIAAPIMLLADAQVYESPLGVERAVLALRRLLDDRASSVFADRRNESRSR